MDGRERRGPPPTRHGHNAYEAISAFQKAVRRSSPEDAAYWATELAQAGLGAWLWKRIRIVVLEDVSPEETGLVSDIRALNEQWSAGDKSNGGDLLAITRAVIALAIAKKNRVADNMMMVLASADCPRREPPDHALDVHTYRGKKMGRGWGHFWEESGRLVQWDGDLAELEAKYEALCREMEQWSG